MSSPEHSVDQQNGNRRQSAMGSPHIHASAEWRPTNRSDNTPADILTPDLNMSPRRNQSAFASINGTKSHTPAHMIPGPGALSGSSMNHPMAISTSMAYGYHPMLATQNSSSNSPPNIHSRRPTLASETSLPSLRHSDSLSSSSAGSPLNTSSAPNPTSLSRGIPSRELPPPFPSRQNCHPQSLPPMKTPGSPPRYSSPSAAITTLLRAGEHLASNGPPESLQDSRYS